MKEQALENSPEYYKRYIQLVSETPFLEALEEGGIELYINELETLEKLGLQVYAPGKWTVNEMIQHLIDTERVFGYRSMRFARNDQTDIPGFDENAYADAVKANNRELSDLLEEYQILRLSNVYFFKNLTPEELQRTGTANGQKISVLAMGYIMIGHPIHHFNVLKERYYSLIQ